MTSISPPISENLVENFDEKSDKIGRIWKNCDSSDGYKDDRWCSINTEFGQPSWFNIRKDSKFIANKFNTFDGIVTKQILTNAQRSNDGTLVSIPNKLVRISNTNNLDSEYCSGKGKFKQTCYQSDGKTLVDCESNDAVYRLNEGFCDCDVGYMGNQCQHSNSITCNGHGVVSSTSKDKTNALQGPTGTFTCDCSPSQYYYTSKADGRTKAYVGNQCQYSDNDNCSGKGYVTSTGTCSSCNSAATGKDCSGNACKNWGNPNQDGTSCICPSAYTGGLCETSKCQTGTYPSFDGTTCFACQNGRPINGKCVCWDPYYGDACDKIATCECKANIFGCNRTYTKECEGDYIESCSYDHNIFSKNFGSHCSCINKTQALLTESPMCGD